MYLTISSSKHMLESIFLIPRLFFYASNGSILDCNISIFLTLFCLYIYYWYFGLTTCHWTECGGSSFNKASDFTYSSECEEGYYSFPGQELWRYFKEKGEKRKIVSVCYLCLFVYLEVEFTLLLLMIRWELRSKVLEYRGATCR